MQFEWDEAKRLVNLGKHGIDFIDCMAMFDGPTAIFPDTRKDYGEERFNVCWRLQGRLMVTTIVIRGDAFRIISARKASKKEEGRYGSNL